MGLCFASEPDSLVVVQMLPPLRCVLRWCCSSRNFTSSQCCSMQWITTALSCRLCQLNNSNSQFVFKSFVHNWTALLLVIHWLIFLIFAEYILVPTSPEQFYNTTTFFKIKITCLINLNVVY